MIHLDIGNGGVLAQLIIMVIPYKGPKCSGNRLRCCKNENWPGQTSARYFPPGARTSTAIWSNWKGSGRQKGRPSGHLASQVKIRVFRSTPIQQFGQCHVCSLLLCVLLRKTGLLFAYFHFSSLISQSKLVRMYWVNWVVAKCRLKRFFARWCHVVFKLMEPTCHEFVS